MPDQGLDHLQRLPVIEHVHDVGMPERVGRHRDRQVHAVSGGPADRRLQPVPHGFIGHGPQRLAPLWPRGGHPALHLVDVTAIGQGHQAHGIFGWPSPPASDLLREDPHKRPRAVQHERLRRQAAGLADARAGVPQRAEQEVVPAVRHVVEQGAHLRRQQVERRHAVCRGHSPERQGRGKIHARRDAQRRDAFW